MADGIKYAYKVEAKAPGLKEVNHDLKESHGHLKNAKHGTESLAHTIRHEFGSVGHSIAYAKNELKELAEVFGVMLGLEALKEITEGISELGKEILKASGHAESLGMSLKLNFGKGEGHELEEWAERVARVLPVTGEEVKGFAVDLGKMGIGMKDVNRYIAAASDVAARSTNKVEAMGEALSVLRRAAGVGKVRGSQLLELGITPESFKVMPGFAGLSKKQVIEKLGKQDIDMEQVFRIIAGPGKNLGEVGKQMGDLLDTKVKNVTTLPEQYFAAWKDSPSFDVFKSKLDELFTSLDPSSPRGKEILSAWNGLITTIVDGVKEINFAELADGLKQIVNVLKEIMSIVKEIIPIMGAFSHAASGAVRQREVQGQALKEVQESKGGFFSKIGKALSSGGGSPYGAFGGFSMPDPQDVGRDVGAGVAKGIGESTQKLKDAGADAVDAAKQGAKEEGKIHSPSALFRDEVGKQIGVGIALGVRGQSRAVQQAIEDVMYVPPARGGSGAGAAGGVTVTVGSLDFHFGGSPTREDAEAAADAFFESFKGRLMSEMEQAMAQSGVR